MIIKKFQAKTENEAVEAAKKELGLEVVVMSVRKVKPKGMFKFLKPQLTEVTVALEEEHEKAVKRERAAAQAAATAGVTANGDVFVNNPPVRSLSQESGEALQKEAVRQESTAVHSATSEKLLEEKLNNLQSFLEKQLMNPPEEGREEEPIEAEQNESVVFMQLLYNTMIENEVEETYANEMIDEIEKVKKENMPIDYVLAHVYQKLILKFGKPAAISPAGKGPKFCFFVGPTGVGKTTTIAKIASRFTVDEKKKVALLTADTYRIAAAEQLRTYAGILEVPFRVIYALEDLEKSADEFKDYDYILVDTAGHSHHNEEQKEAMKRLVHGVDDIAEKEVFLVISATTKYRDLISIADAYKAMTDYKLIFTKLDETMTLGNLLNLKLYTGASLSYVTCGQNVPDDIEKFNPQTTVKQLLGGKK